MPGVRHLACVLLALALTAPLGGSPGSGPSPDPDPDTETGTGTDSTPNSPERVPDPTPPHTAVLDRFEGNDAVLVVDDGGSIAIAATRLPVAGRHVDAVFAVRLAHGALTSVEYDPGETRRRARSAREEFARLARAHPDSERVPSTSTGSPTESSTPTSDSGTCVFTMRRK